MTKEAHWRASGKGLGVQSGAHAAEGGGVFDQQQAHRVVPRGACGRRAAINEKGHPEGGLSH